MTVELDPQTLSALRGRSAAELVDEAHRMAWGLPGGPDSSEYLEILEAFVAAGLLTWADVEALDDVRE